MFDVLIQNGMVIDGTGTPAFYADIAIKDGKITVLRNESREVKAKTTVDATGKFVSPGFIDAHSHGDMFFENMSHSLAKSSQGITTEVCGHCGCSDFPTAADPELYAIFEKESPRVSALGRGITANFASYRKYIESVSKTTNIRMLVGHNAIRRSVLGSQNRAPNALELEYMKSLLRECLENGAAGFTSGLIYPPGVFARQYEMSELCKVAAEYHTIYTTHIRDEGDDVISAVQEALDTAGEADCPLIISHHKIAGYANWGKSEKTLQMIDNAIDAGQKVALDLYPFLASMTGLSACLPPEEFTYPLDERVARMNDPIIRAEIKEKYRTRNVKRYNQLRSLDDVLLISCAHTPEYNGKTLTQLAGTWGVDPIDAMLNVLAENQCSVSAAYFSMCEEDLCRIFMHKRTMLGTDGLVYSAIDPTHPRGFCSFPEAIDYFVKTKKLLTLEQAIHKMTGLTADWYKLQNKGYIKDGYDADLVILDYQAVKSGFTYGENVKMCPGICKVFVRGVVTYEDGELTGKTPGVFLPA